MYNIDKLFTAVNKRNKEVSKFKLHSSGVPSPEAVDELHN